jgi:hypothetical protein
MLPVIQLFPENDNTPGEEECQDEYSGDQPQPGVYGENELVELPH